MEHPHVSKTRITIENLKIIHSQDIDRKQNNRLLEKPGVKPVQELEEYQVRSRMQLNGGTLTPKRKPGARIGFCSEEIITPSYKKKTCT